MNELTQKLAKVCEAIEGKKGEGILILDISQVSSFTEFFILCHGSNRKQNSSDCRRGARDSSTGDPPGPCGRLRRRRLGPDGLSGFRGPTSFQSPPVASITWRSCGATEPKSTPLPA